MNIFLVILSILFLTVGCIEDRPYYAPVKLDPTLPERHTCNDLLSLGYKIDTKKCAEHIDHPKFKKGEYVTIVGDKYARGCKLLVKRSIWAVGTEFDKPAYDGQVLCLDPNDDYVVYEDSVQILESNLRAEK